MEDLLMDREKWIVVCPSTHLIGMLVEEWEKLERRLRIMIQLCLAYSVFLNVSSEYSAKKRWDKSLVNKFFLKKKLYLQRMSDGSFVANI